MRNAKLGVGVGALVAGVAIAAACTSNDNPGAGGGGDGGASSSGTSSGASSSGTSSSGTSSSGTSSSGTSSSGTSSSGTSSGAAGDGGISFGPTIQLPGLPGAMAYDPTTNEAWVASSAQTDAGTTFAAITIIDTTTFSVKTTLTMNANSAGYGPILFAPDLGKAYVSSQTTPDGGFGAEVDEVDVTTHAWKTVTTYQSPIDGALGMAYDAASHKVYVSVDDSHYMFVIDATADTVLATWPNSALGDAGIGGGFGGIALDPTGSVLFLSTGDKNQYPMVATMPTDGGLPYDVLGGQAAGWVGSTGLVVLTADGGATGATDILLSDGGAFMQLIDPGTFSLPAGDTPAAVHVSVFNQRVYIAVRDACGHERIRSFMMDGTPAASWLADNTDLRMRDYVPVDPPTATGAAAHALVNFQPPPAGSSGGGATLDAITEITIDNNAKAESPCP